MLQTLARFPRLRQDSIQRAQCKLSRALHSQHLRRLQVGGNAQRIPVHVHGLVDVRCGPFQACLVQLLLGRIQHRRSTVYGHAVAHRDLLHRRLHPEHILRRIVVHVANFADVVVSGRDLQFIRREDGTRLFQRPGEVIAVVFHRVVGILGTVEAAVLAVAEPLIHPANNVARHRREERNPGGLIGTDIILQQLRVVI